MSLTGGLLWTACLSTCTWCTLLSGYFDDLLTMSILIRYLVRFYQKADSNSSRKLFRYSLIHLPLLMTLMCLGKKSQQDKEKELLDKAVAV